MMLYGITLGKRYSKKQKAQFVEHICKEAKQCGYPVKLQSKQGKTRPLHNVIVGDLDSAKKVVIAAYDTPSKIYIPDYKYYPFNITKHLNQEKLNFFIQSILGFVAVLIAYFIWWQGSSYSLVIQVLTSVIAFLCICYAYAMFKGKANRCNFNRNSASIALLVSMMNDMKQDATVAFVFLDQGVNSYEGLRYFVNELQHQQVLLLDCLAQGELLVCAHCDHVKSHSIINNTENLEFYDKCYESSKVQHNVLSIYDNMLYLASGDMLEKQFVIRNTRSKQDYHVDLERLEKIKQTIISYLQG